MNLGRVGSLCLVAAAIVLASVPAVTGFGADAVLSKPAVEGGMSLAQALASRRSVRAFRAESLTVQDVAKLLWAAQGITGTDGKRTAPSAGALYPLMVYVVAGKVKGLSPGVYRYKPDAHEIVKVKGADQRARLAAAAGGQRSVLEAPASFVIAVNYHRMDLYDRKGKMFADMEQGHAAQNLLLEAVALGLGAVPVGAADEIKAGKVLDLPGDFTAAYIIPVGHPK
jgi:SagB-type dehydrogenase family enzyme